MKTNAYKQIQLFTSLSIYFLKNVTLFITLTIIENRENTFNIFSNLSKTQILSI